MSGEAVRSRREPPRFRRVEVVSVEDRTPRLRRITLGGDELHGLTVTEPAASVRLLLPRAGGSEVVLPRWNGNEFLFDDGTRPPIRTLTPLRTDPGDDDRAPRLDVEIVRHGDGALSDWADRARPGDPAAVAGTGRGYEIAPHADSFLLVGDESALPAIVTLLDVLPAAANVRVLVEVGDDARLELPVRAGWSVHWFTAGTGAATGDALVGAVRDDPPSSATRVWAAGEAAAMQRLRRLLGELGHDRSLTVVRGYWKLGRRSAGSD